MKKMFVAAVFLAFSGVTFAEKISLSCDDAVKIALEKNVSVSRSQITLEAAERTKNHSWNSVSPTASVSATSSVPVDALSDKSADYTANAGISATVNLSLSANLYTSIQTARLNYEQQKISFDDAVRSIELSVRQNYYGLLYEKENITLQEENLKIARTQYENNLAKYNSGRLSEVDALSAEVNYKSKIPNVESARTTYENDLDSFKQILGLMPEDEIELTGTLNDVLYLKEITVEEKDINSSEIRALEAKLEAARTSVLDKRFSAFAPSLSASFKWADQYWYIGGKGQYENADPSKSAAVSLSATIPLDGVLPWSARNDAVDSAKDNVKDLELQLADKRVTVKREVDALVRSIRQGQQAISYRQASVQLAQKTYDMTLEAYNRGTKDLLALQNANSTLLSAKVSLNSEILNLKKSILTLENKIGAESGSLTKQGK